MVISAYILFAVVFLLIWVCVAIGVTIGVGIFALVSAAIALGMISSSVACGLIQKKPSTGFRIFFYQFFILLFIAAGVLATGLISSISDMHLSLASISIIGSLSGLGVGLLFGLLHSWMIDLLAGFLLRMFSRLKNAA